MSGPEPTPGLREAAQEVVSMAEPDDDYDGDFIDYLVPGVALDNLRAALAASPAPEPTGLDADRLRVVLRRWLDMATEAGLVGHVPPPEWLAAEYVRLEEKP